MDPNNPSPEDTPQPEANPEDSNTPAVLDDSRIISIGAENKSKMPLIMTIIVVLVVVLVLAGVFAFMYFTKNNQAKPATADLPAEQAVVSPPSQVENAPINTQPVQPTPQTAKGEAFKKITEPKLLFTGGYADPTIVKNSGGSLTMFLNNFSVQPAKYQAHTSADGITWDLASAKLPDASTGRAVKFGSQTRLYYPDRTPIKPTDPPASILSAISADGFTFTNESGTRVDPRDGYYLEGPTVFQLKDGTYRMYFSENDSASAEKRISSIWGASSTDGVVWERDAEVTLEASVQDEGIPPDWPQALHPFVLTRSDGTYLMLYNTHSEVFAATSEDGIHWTKKGDTGIHGADVDGYYLDSGAIRLYYGDFSPETLGVVYTIDIEEL